LVCADLTAVCDNKSRLANLEGIMGFKNRTALLRTAAVLGIVAAVPATVLDAQVSPAGKSGATDIGGTVVGPKGPEAGVWVIAETGDLPTKYAKIVVTDDQGRFLVPGLPKAHYRIWVRGYGLVDSTKVAADPGATLSLKATPAPTPAAAAAYYPAIYWYSMLQIPDKKLFPGSGKNGMSPNVKDQGQWLHLVKTDGCITCHQIGDEATRTFPASLGKFDKSSDAWERRIQSGQASSNMINSIGQLDTQRALSLFGECPARVASSPIW
jgi:hypothetical protein